MLVHACLLSLSVGFGACSEDKLGFGSSLGCPAWLTRGITFKQDPVHHIMKPSLCRYILKASGGM